MGSVEEMFVLLMAIGLEKGDSTSGGAGEERRLEEHKAYQDIR